MAYLIIRFCYCRLIVYSARKYLVGASCLVFHCGTPLFRNSFTSANSAISARKSAPHPIMKSGRSASADYCFAPGAMLIVMSHRKSLAGQMLARPGVTIDQFPPSDFFTLGDAILDGCAIEHMATLAGRFCDLVSSPSSRDLRGYELDRSAPSRPTAIPRVRSRILSPWHRGLTGCSKVQFAQGERLTTPRRPHADAGKRTAKSPPDIVRRAVS
jgi:hypothetical protein